jgi:hypothetical protein
VLCAAAVIGCGQPPPSAPTETPPTASTIRLGDWSASNGRWTFNATVNPRGGPTHVVLEYGLGTESAPVFDTTLEVETGILDARALTATIQLPEEASFCARFAATNEVGSVSTEPFCQSQLSRPSVVVVGPDQSAAASALP